MTILRYPMRPFDSFQSNGGDWGNRAGEKLATDYAMD